MTTPWKIFDIDTDTSQLQNQTQNVTLISCNLEPDITITTPQKIFVLSYISPDPFTAFTSSDKGCDPIKLEKKISIDDVDEDGI